MLRRCRVGANTRSMSNHGHVEGCRVCSLVAGAEPELVVHASSTFHVVSLPPPVPLPGWVMLAARRHVAGAGSFDDHEADVFGRALRHAAAIVERETGALRVYVAALGEADAHFHAHLVPRYAELREGKKGFAMFELQRMAQEGSLSVDPAAVSAMIAKLRAAFAADPLPR